MNANDMIKMLITINYICLDNKSITINVLLWKGGSNRVCLTLKTRIHLSKTEFHSFSVIYFCWVNAVRRRYCRTAAGNDKMKR